jgi:hypothetical protein
VNVSEIWIGDDSRLCVRFADASLDLTQIYRASASGVTWDPGLRALCSPVPREWSYEQWFVRMVEDARGEYGLDLVLADSTIWRGVSSESRMSIEATRATLPPYKPKRVDDRTMAGYVGDDRLRQEARECFLQKQWTATVAKLEALQHPQFMDAADVRRLEIARKRSQGG